MYKVVRKLNENKKILDNKDKQIVEYKKELPQKLENKLECKLKQ